MALLSPVGLLYNSGAYGEDNPKANPNGFLEKNHLSAIPSGLNHYTLVARLAAPLRSPELVEAIAAFVRGEPPAQR